MLWSEWFDRWIGVRALRIGPAGNSCGSCLTDHYGVEALGRIHGHEPVRLVDFLRSEPVPVHGVLQRRALRQRDGDENEGTVLGNQFVLLSATVLPAPTDRLHDGGRIDHAVPIDEVEAQHAQVVGGAAQQSAHLER